METQKCIKILGDPYRTKLYNAVVKNQWGGPALCFTLDLNQDNLNVLFELFEDEEVSEVILRGVDDEVRS